MHDNQFPPCIVRTSPNTYSMPIEISYLSVGETEYLLDYEEELISTPMKVTFDSTVYEIFIFLRHISFSFLVDK